MSTEIPLEPLYTDDLTHYLSIYVNAFPDRRVREQMAEVLRAISHHVHVVITGRVSTQKDSVVRAFTPHSSASFSLKGRAVTYSGACNERCLRRDLKTRSWCRHEQETHDAGSLGEGLVEQWWMHTPQLSDLPSLSLSIAPGLSSTAIEDAFTWALCAKAKLCLVVVRATQAGGIEELNLISCALHHGARVAVVIADAGEIASDERGAIQRHLRERLVEREWNQDDIAVLFFDDIQGESAFALLGSLLMSFDLIDVARSREGDVAASLRVLMRSLTSFMQHDSASKGHALWALYHYIEPLCQEQS